MVSVGGLGGACSEGWLGGACSDCLGAGVDGLTSGIFTVTGSGIVFAGVLAAIFVGSFGGWVVGTSAVGLIATGSAGGCLRMLSFNGALDALDLSFAGAVLPPPAALSTPAKQGQTPPIAN